MQRKNLLALVDWFITALIIVSVVCVFAATFALPAGGRRFIAGFETFASIVFTIEYLIRLARAEHKLRYAFSFMAIVDLVAVLPFYLPMILPSSMLGVRVLRLVRLLRILKLNRYFDAMAAIGEVIHDKRRELLGSMFFVSLLMLISSLLMYSAEHDAQPEVFRNAFSGLWWAVATITTVGYGDIYPVTVAGKLLGTLIALSGVAAVAIPTGIVSSGMMERFERRRKPVKCPHCGKELMLFFLCAFLPLASIADLSRDIDFLLKYAPPQDLPVPGEYATNNCVLAALARETAIETYPDEIYLDYVLPYAVIREGRDEWRSEFRERFLPLVAGSTNAYEAAVTLDRKIWDMIGVHYNVNRDKARQSPRHSMRIGMASCTGISIILIDACRAVGIPARLVGCNWTTIPGNHSWVEVWSEGRWRVLASGEKEREDDIWFLEYAAQADASRPDKRIYACRWSPSPEGTLFWQTWEFPQKVSDVPADDVTENYKRGAK